MLTQAYSEGSLQGAGLDDTFGAPLFFMPGHNGCGFLPQALRLRINRVRCCYDGLRYPGLADQELPLSRVEDIASHVIAQIRRRRPAGPYGFCGYSFGGLVAYEVARQLRDQGLEVDALILWECSIPTSITVCRRPIRQAATELIARLKRRNAAERRRLLRTLIWNKWEKAAFQFWDNARRKTTDAFRWSATRREDCPRQTPEEVLVNASVVAEKSYFPEPYAGDAVVFEAIESGGVFNRPTLIENRGWNSLIRGKLDVVKIPGCHLDIWDEPAITVLAERTADWLRKRQTGRSKKVES